MNGRVNNSSSFPLHLGHILWTGFTQNILVLFRAAMFLFSILRSLAELFRRHNTDICAYILKLQEIEAHLEFQAWVYYFYQIFIFSPNDSPSKTMKNAFYFILFYFIFVLEIFRFSYFHPSLFFSLSAVALENDQR